MEPEIKELCDMKDRYDPVITAALMQLVREKYLARGAD